MRSSMKSLLLGAATLAMSISVHAADLHSGQGGQYSTVVGYSAAPHATGGYFTAFYYESGRVSHRRFYAARFVEMNYCPIIYDTRALLVSDNPAPAGVDKTWKKISKLDCGGSFTQKLLSSTSYRGSPSNGFHHVLGKIPMSATKMIA